MRRNNPLANLICRFWPGSHNRFRQICVLAATGQLGGPEMSELNEHIIRCKWCRKYLESITQASVQIMAALADEHLSRTEIAPPDGMRSRFLARVATSERKFVSDPTPSRYPALATTRVFVTKAAGERLVRKKKTMVPMRAGVLPLAARAMAAVAVCTVVWLAGYYGGHRRLLQPMPHAANSSLASAPLLDVASARQSANRVSELEQRKAALESLTREYEQEFSAATAENKILATKLSIATEKLALLNAEGQSHQQPAQERQDADNQISFLQSEIAKLRWHLQASEAKVAEQEKQSDALTKELEQAESELRRESDVRSAKQEIGDLVAARNLHIIDVYDADNGARQHCFGRVFYVEGKSLVFYVYDLADPRQLNADIVFRVWGEKSGMKQTTHSLGILHNEETSHDRWTLRFDDPKVLAEINSVFVTAEVANKNYSEPHGKKVLYAFFGSPSNHP
jgi:hypothetical protein